MFLTYSYFLGLRTLTVVKDSVKNIKRSTGLDINIESINLNDKNVLDFIGTGKTEGVFQLESKGMQGFMKELKPQNFEDIIAGISLYRPGPMDFIPKYISGKNNPNSISYACPELESILSPTYGCIVYQEQVMQIVQKLAGYTMGQADNIRRAMSKKKQYVIDEEREFFVNGSPEKNIKGCVANGISSDVANSIYDSMVDFAKYAFNKSHAAAYAVISMQTAWLKCYYPIEYMAALMTSVMDNPEKLTGYINASKNIGVNMLCPNINKSMKGFTVEESSIRYSLSFIKGVGIPSVEAIIERRNKYGDFISFSEFLKESASLGVNKKLVESFIKAGVFDTFVGNRHQFLESYESIMENLKKESKKAVPGQISLFQLSDENTKEKYDINLPDIKEYKKNFLLEMEKEVTGVYITGHPLQDYEEIMKKNCTNKAEDLILDETINNYNVYDGQEVVMAGLITEKKVIYSKKNQAMAFLSIEDLTGNYDVIVFPKIFEKMSKKLPEGKKVFIYGRISIDEGKKPVILASKILNFEDIPRKVWIQIQDLEDYKKREDEIIKSLFVIPGNSDVFIYIKKENVKKIMKEKIFASEKNIEYLKEIYGDKNIAIKS